MTTAGPRKCPGSRSTTGFSRPVSPVPGAVLLLLLGLSSVFLGACAVSLPRVAEMTDTEGIEALQAEFDAEHFQAASITAKAFLTAHPGSKHLDQAIYILARSNYEQGGYLDAEDNYRRLLRDFPQSDYSEDSAYYLGLAMLSQARGPQLDQSETLAAQVQLRSFLSQYPDSKYGERAKYHIATIRNKLANKEYDNAMVYYRGGMSASFAARFYFETRVYQAFPETEWAAKALIKLCDLERKRLHWDLVAQWAGRYLADFPDGPERDKAREYLDEARQQLQGLDLPAAENPPGAGAGGESPRDHAGGDRR